MKTEMEEDLPSDAAAASREGPRRVSRETRHVSWLDRYAEAEIRDLQEAGSSTTRAAVATARRATQRCAAGIAARVRCDCTHSCIDPAAMGAPVARTLGRPAPLCGVSTRQEAPTAHGDCCMLSSDMYPRIHLHAQARGGASQSDDEPACSVTAAAGIRPSGQAHVGQHAHCASAHERAKLFAPAVRDLHTGLASQGQTAAPAARPRARGGGGWCCGRRRQRRRR